MTAMPAARVTDPFGHSSAMTGVLTGLAIGALVGVAIIATGGLGAIAIGAAIATTGAAGLAGQAIGQTIDGPITGVLQNGSLNVRINRLAATMVMIGTGTCSQDSGLRKVASGSSTVKINGQLAARVSETMDCSAVIRKGSPNVNIGGPTEQVLAIETEVPAWLTTTMTVAAIGGTILATGGIAATYGAGAAIGSLVGGLGGGYLGGKGGEMAAAAMGYGATGQAVGGVLGGLAGGALGGAAGFRGGAAALTPKTPVTPALAAEKPMPAGPAEAYNRAAHYGRTPTAADRTAVGAGRGQVADHSPPLVQRYYEGDPATGEMPGWQMTPAQRAASAADRTRMSPQPRADSDSQGGKMSAYSRKMKRKHGL